MKKVFMMLALLAIPFVLQAQTKFHDVEANEAKGAVKSIKTEVMGQERVVKFTADGKEEGLIDAKYDADGYLQSSKMKAQDMEVSVTYVWENGLVKSQSMMVMGQEIPTKNTYNEKGELVSQSMFMMGQNLSVPYSDYKYDDHGNWISRKATMMGQTMEQTRTIEYYQ